MVMSGWASQQTPEVKFLKRLTTAIASRYVPGAVEAIGKKAMSGDLEAARLLLGIITDGPKGGG